MERSLQADLSVNSYPLGFRMLFSAVLIGALVGAAGWLINLFLQRYFIDPVFCASSDTAGACSNGSTISWVLAHVLVVGASVVAMVSAAVYRPLLVALAAFATVWGIGSWLGDLDWWSATLWQMLIFGLAYGAYAWIARTVNFWVAAIATIAVVVLCRLALLWA